ncbi:VOC family protein [Streptomyces sp. NPDC048489]|uniref:VOC family protein n=1 Tax=Streptomyces sp. NPDC048489 TaxID=3154504 RepID=UPI003435A271
MTDSPMQIKALIVDAAAPERLATFWSVLRGRPVVARIGPYLWLRREGGRGLGFQQTAEPKSGKNRMRFDITLPNPPPSSDGSRRSAVAGWSSTPTAGSW